MLDKSKFLEQYTYLFLKAIYETLKDDDHIKAFIKKENCH